MRLKNTSGGRVEQLFEGKRYIWEGDGDVMTLPDGLGAWMLGKLNSPDSNPDLKAKRQETGKPDLVFLAMLPAKKGDQVADLNVVRAEKAAKPADPAPAAK